MARGGIFPGHDEYLSANVYKGDNGYLEVLSHFEVAS
jgi:hypothetical protein